MNIESNLRYFNPKVNFTVMFLAVLGIAMLAIGYREKSTLFMIVGGVLILLGGYQFFWNRTHKITGAQLDQSSKAVADKLPLKKSALEALCLDAEDVLDWTGIILMGYCMTGIRTEPLFRRDETDGRLRSSNYQVTVFWFGPKKLYVYSTVKSLVDKENLEQGHMWRYTAIKHVDIVTKNFIYIVGNHEDKRETAEISYLRLKDSKGASYTFAFDGSADAAEKIERIQRLVREKAASLIEPGGNDDDTDGDEEKNSDAAPKTMKTISRKLKHRKHT